MGVKDYFSSHAHVYATFRPSYPDALYQFIFQYLNNRTTVWDCATGNGQVAQHLAKYFQKVYATDISKGQLENAIQAPKIIYSISKAEETDFEENQFDLVTVGQALHWFNLDLFYNEVKRVTRPGGLLAVWGYALLSVNPKVDNLFLDFYNNTVGPFWDNARKLVEEEYRNIPFPFDEIPSRKFSIQVDWTREQFAGYLRSWSATQKFIQTKGYNPVEEFAAKFTEVWHPTESKTVTFPVFLKLGKVG